MLERKAAYNHGARLLIHHLPTCLALQLGGGAAPVCAPGTGGGTAVRCRLPSRRAGGGALTGG